MAIKANLVIDQGSDFTTNIQLRDEAEQYVDLEGFSARGQLRKTYSSSNAVDFTVEIILPTSELFIALSSAQTANLTSGRYVYDIELTTRSGVLTRIVEGIVTVTPEVTR
jgi:hypothetical protein